MRVRRMYISLTVLVAVTLLRPLLLNGDPVEQLNNNLQDALTFSKQALDKWQEMKQLANLHYPPNLMKAAWFNIKQLFNSEMDIDKVHKLLDIPSKILEMEIPFANLLLKLANRLMKLMHARNDPHKTDQFERLISKFESSGNKQEASNDLEVRYDITENKEIAVDALQEWYQSATDSLHSVFRKGKDGLENDLYVYKNEVNEALERLAIAYKTITKLLKCEQ